MSLVDDAKKILGDSDRSSESLKKMQFLYKQAIKNNDKESADYISNLIEAFLVDGGIESLLKD